MSERIWGRCKLVTLELVAPETVALEVAALEVVASELVAVYELAQLVAVLASAEQRFAVGPR